MEGPGLSLESQEADLAARLSSTPPTSYPRGLSDSNQQHDRFGGFSMTLLRTLLIAGIVSATFVVHAGTKPDKLVGTWVADGASPWTEESRAGFRLILRADGKAAQVRDGKRITMKYRIREPNLLDLVGDRGHDTARFFVSGDSLMLIIDDRHTLELSRAP